MGEPPRVSCEPIGPEIWSNSMQKSWTGSAGHDLCLELRWNRGRRPGLGYGLRNAIRAGRLLAGTRLPSSRALARDLGLARGTVVEAYEQLIAEGYLTARRGRGTSVAAGAHPAGVAARPSSRPTRAAALVPGAPDLATFPRRRWLAALRRALATAPDRALDYGDPRGLLELRETLARYLGRTRGVAASADRLVICSGFVQAWAVLRRALRFAGASGSRSRIPGTGSTARLRKLMAFGSSRFRSMTGGHSLVPSPTRTLPPCS